MSEQKPNLTREERLAARLRENLKRRKHQARALAREGQGPDDGPDDALSKMPEGG